jgi:hypothetical protein
MSQKNVSRSKIPSGYKVITAQFGNAQNCKRFALVSVGHANPDVFIYNVSNSGKILKRSFVSCVYCAEGKIKHALKNALVRNGQKCTRIL